MFVYQSLLEAESGSPFNLLATVWASSSMVGGCVAVVSFAMIRSIPCSWKASRNTLSVEKKKQKTWKIILPNHNYGTQKKILKHQNDFIESHEKEMK